MNSLSNGSDLRPVMNLGARRDANTTVDAIAAVEHALDEVELVYYAIVSLNGRLLTKIVPKRHLRRSLERGVQFHSSAVADLTTTRDGRLLGGGAEGPELTALPVPETAVRLPWDPSVAVVFCELYEREDFGDNPGSVSPFDVRARLGTVHRGFTARTGFTLKSGCEPEMSWISEEKPFVRPGLAPNYHLATLEDSRPLVKQIIRYAQALGLDMIEGDYEDIYQIELNWMFDLAERTADRLLLYRLACRQVAKEFGVKASFMPKPFEGLMGNGCHHNLSLWRTAPDGTESNAFVDEGRTEIHVSSVARSAIGGLLHNAARTMAVMAPTVNSYKRFADVGLFAPAVVNWGEDNKTCTVRVSASGRLEFKIPDASVNPYLSHALVLAMFEDGLTRELDPGDPVAGDSAHRPPTSGIAPLPRTLGDAVALLDGDALATAALGRPLLDLFVDAKRDEWARSCGAVTDWDRAQYLDFLP